MNVVISRSDANSKGLSRYFSGRPCRHGHIAERYVCTYACVICDATRAEGRKRSLEQRIRIANYGRAYRKAHEEKRTVQIKKWVAENKQRVAARQRAWYVAHYAANRSAYAEESRRRYRNAVDTPIGRLRTTYCNMRKRIEGRAPGKAHLYVGKSLLPRDQLIAWGLSDPAFLRLFAKWQASGKNPVLSPSIDRINSDLGYELGNMRWLTGGENSELGATSRWQVERLLDAA